jgi:hypothetical protein
MLSKIEIKNQKIRLKNNRADFKSKGQTKRLSMWTSLYAFCLASPCLVLSFCVRLHGSLVKTRYEV